MYKIITIAFAVYVLATTGISKELTRIGDKVDYVLTALDLPISELASGGSIKASSATVDGDVTTQHGFCVYKERSKSSRPVSAEIAHSLMQVLREEGWQVRQLTPQSAVSQIPGFFSVVADKKAEMIEVYVTIFVGEDKVLRVSYEQITTSKKA